MRLAVSNSYPTLSPPRRFQNPPQRKSQPSAVARKLIVNQGVVCLPRKTDTCPGNTAEQSGKNSGFWVEVDTRGLLPPVCLTGNLQTVSDELKMKEQEQKVKIGHSIEVLRATLPKFFEESAPMDIYAEDVAFVDDISPRLGLQPVTVVGKEKYSTLLWSLRFHASLFCCGVKVSILRFWQPCSDRVMVRWGITMYPRLLNGVYGTKMHCDGLSEFKFNREGEIFEHRVDVLETSGMHFNLNLQYLLQHSPSSASLIPTC